MTQENPSSANAKKPRVVRVTSDDTHDAWETQRAEFLAAHPEEASKPIKDELVREALGLPEEQETEEEPKEKAKQEETEKTETEEKETESGEELKMENEEKEEATEEKASEEEAAEKARVEDEESEDEAGVAEEKEEEEEEKETEETESRVEVEKPAQTIEGKPKIKSITETAKKQEEPKPQANQQPKKPRLIESFEEQAARDIMPSAPAVGTPITMTQTRPTLGEASNEVRAEEARRIWAQREEQKRAKLGFFGKIKAKLGFR